MVPGPSNNMAMASTSANEAIQEEDIHLSELARNVGAVEVVKLSEVLN